MILVDAGPLVTLIHEDDQQHQRCKEEFLSMREPLGTLWPVLTEAMYLLRFSWEAQNALWEIAVWGRPRATNDVDFLVLVNEGDLGRLGERMTRVGMALAL